MVCRVRSNGVWTDFIQFVLMLAANITVISYSDGGFKNAWSTVERDGRRISFH